MLLDFQQLYKDYDCHVTGVLHIGAHTAEEAECYNDLGITNVVWVEPNPDLIPQVHANVDRFGHKVIEALITDEDHLMTGFNVTNINGMSSSILQFGKHPEFSPEIVFEKTLFIESRTIDSIVEEYGLKDINMLSMDIQGAELLALRGGVEFLENIDYLMSEVNQEEIYLGCAKVWELDALLDDYGLIRNETHWVGDQGWGDAWYVRSN